MGISEGEILIKCSPCSTPEYSGVGSLRNRDESKIEKYNKMKRKINDQIFPLS